jgi:DNA-binding transcriptional regulator YiaG
MAKSKTMDQLLKEAKQDLIKTLRKASGMSQDKFAEYFNIPVSTLRKWEQGVRECPLYLIELIEYKLIKENIL